METTKLVYSIISIVVAITVICSLLIPTITEQTASGQPGADYAGLLGAVIVISVVSVLMMAVRMIGGKN